MNDIGVSTDGNVSKKIANIENNDVEQKRDDIIEFNGDVFIIPDRFGIPLERMPTTYFNGTSYSDHFIYGLDVTEDSEDFRKIVLDAHLWGDDDLMFGEVRSMDNTIRVTGSKHRPQNLVVKKVVCSAAAMQYDTAGKDDYLNVSEKDLCIEEIAAIPVYVWINEYGKITRITFA